MGAAMFFSNAFMNRSLNFGAVQTSRSRKAAWIPVPATSTHSFGSVGPTELEMHEQNRTNVRLLVMLVKGEHVKQSLVLCIKFELP